ncbi:MAG: histidine kinase [Betaproteobacteria bacterium]|nr:histidine kinase [Betaproteobacteria bacterium]
MKNSLASHERLNLIARARQAVLVDGQPNTPLVQDWISNSWRRCLHQGMKAEHSVTFNPLSTGQTKQALDQNHELIQVAKPELERIGRAIAGTQFFALITNAQGVLLDVRGAIDRHDKRVSSIARVGVDLSEKAVGTTAISAALIEQRPVWLHRGEHFFNDTAVYSCAGAPLWGSHGECIGMLDLTGVQTPERPELMHLAALSARSISNALLLAQPHHLLLRLNWPGRLMGDDNDGLVLLGADGQILGANPWAREMLNLNQQPAVHASDMFALPWGLLFDAAVSPKPVEVPLWSGLQLQAQACLQQPCGFVKTNTPSGPLHQLQSAMINKAIEHARGNVAQAAKALGISRATLYRKLSRKSTH